MRTQFIRTLTELAASDERIWLINGDLGYSVLEAFRDKFPARYVNAGVAEQNMTGVSAGLALAGKIPVTYSIANFPTFRCLEQVRNDVGYHNLSVKIVSVGGGYAYGSAGYTHHAVEDIAVMRAIPNMVVLAPGDPMETDLATKAMMAHAGPCYLRLGKAGEPAVHKTPPAFTIGKGITIREGSDVVLISTGGMLVTTLAAADLLASRGKSVGVVSMPTIQPVDVALIERVARTAKLLATVEEHGPGGLGTAVGEAVLRLPARPQFHAFRLEGPPVSMAGSQVTLRSRHGLTPEGIATESERRLKA
jgi:transketolase